MSETTDLHRRLDELAELGLRDAAPALADQAWTRGRAWQRRRRQMTALVAGAAALVVLVVGVGAQQLASLDTAPAPATPGEAGPRLPDRLYDASGWLPGTEGEPPGVLSAVVDGYRDAVWGAGEPALLGISSQTGAYRFLDLPGRARTEEPQTESVALSPDGRRLAYWLEGEPDGEPNRAVGSVVVGVAVQDLVSGEVVRHRLPTEHGLSTEDLSWADGTLWFSWFQLAGVRGFAGVDGTTASWQVGVAEPRTWEGLPVQHLYATTSTGQTLVSGLGDRVQLLTPEARRMVDLDTRSEGPASLSPSGERLAVTLDPDGANVSDTGPRQVAVGEVGADGQVELRAVSTAEALEVVGWRDEDHVVVRSRRDGVPSVVYQSIDVDTGEVEPIVQGDQVVAVAQQAWSGDIFAAPEPPSPMDPRLQWSLLVGVPLAALLGLLVWRRRDRP
ncbi:hypothetical protein QWJ41_05210 [Nocardioides sp. SOB44]|uniref:WD40 repeat domain-containing protein n=1 Tax=Nocardioides cremeus TaxID=3058044 RepID=A0ABT8TMB3_9ACTN|nr:hypothetical protein [Nocardioides cremeus]MDO3395105.1 hypothetical protein [Nocardioides cremeus]